jgi:hypothetical protein
VCRVCRVSCAAGDVGLTNECGAGNTGKVSSGVRLWELDALGERAASLHSEATEGVRGFLSLAVSARYLVATTVRALLLPNTYASRLVVPHVCLGCSHDTHTRTHAHTHTRTHTTVGLQGAGVRLWAKWSIDPVGGGAGQHGSLAGGKDKPGLCPSVATKTAARRARLPGRGPQRPR